MLLTIAWGAEALIGQYAVTLIAVYVILSLFKVGEFAMAISSRKPFIDADCLQRAMAERDVVVVDCRFSLAAPEMAEQLYSESHIEGAHPRPIDAVDSCQRHDSCPRDRCDTNYHDHRPWSQSQLGRR